MAGGESGGDDGVIEVGDFDYDVTFWDTPGAFGSAPSVTGDAPTQSAVERLRRVVEEVTGKPVVQATRIGFY